VPPWPWSVVRSALTPLSDSLTLAAASRTVRASKLTIDAGLILDAKVRFYEPRRFSSAILPGN
jgi:hypothetical protein